MSKKLKKELAEFLSGITDAKSMDAVLANLLTPQEHEELTVRLQIFKMLLEGKSQREIAKKLKVSLATVSRGSRELKYGPPGVRKFLKNKNG